MHLIIILNNVNSTFVSILNTNINQDAEINNIKNTIPNFITNKYINNYSNNVNSTF
jgi:hypothetical protein